MPGECESFWKNCQRPGGEMDQPVLANAGTFLPGVLPAFFIGIDSSFFVITLASGCMRQR
jgi:hypothetical protein